MIALKNISYGYAGTEALKDITLHIKKGEAVALLGANGCGKSTLLKLINGIISPDKGEYFFDGERITTKTLQDNRFAKHFHQRVGFVFQHSDTQLFCADVYDEVAFGPRQMGLPEKEVSQRVDDCLKLLGIKDLEHRQPYHLSGGEKKKVAIACVLSLNPDVLVLDEPMNGLDPRTQRWLVEFLSKLSSTGKTLITSTHNLELVQSIATRGVLFNEDHEIVADMPMTELLMKFELLKQVNLVDEFYHQHVGKHHVHYHMHTFGEKREDGR
ncbi:MAG: ABC transporter ATP-binding protein [Clostridiaceae bacterium]